jgi:hypothetical protein
MQTGTLGTGGRTSPEFTTPLSRRMRRSAKLAARGAAVARSASSIQTIAAPQPSTGGRTASARSWLGQTLLFVGLMAACGAWIAVSAWHRSAGNIRTQWLAVEATLITLCVVAGLATNGRADGIFIDEENRISLSRVQWAAWFVVLFGGFFVESIWNIAVGWSDPIKGSFPEMQADLYALLGIVSGSAVVGSAIIDDNIASLSQGRCAYVWGVVYYHDGFGNRRFTRFCHRYAAIGHDPYWRTSPTRTVIPESFARYHTHGNEAD